MGKSRSAIKSNVDPKIAAIAILFVLGVVQVIWWKGLVSMNRGKQGFGAQGAGPTRPDPYVQGMETVQVETLAGAPDPGDKDGIGRLARFDTPSGIGVDKQGGVYVADTRNNRIRYVASDGRTQTVSGREAGFRDGAAEQALFHGPTGLAVTADDQVYIADTLNHRIRRIRRGIVETIAGGEAGMADGPGASARFNLPAGMSIADGGRKLYIADSGNKRIRVLDIGSAGATVNTVAQTTSAPTCAQQAGTGIATTLPDEGAIILGSARSKDMPVELGESRGVIPEGSIALRNPAVLLASSNGWYAADSAHAAIFLLANGSARVIAGETKKSPGPMIGFRDGSGDKAAFGLIAGLASDSSGTIYAADATNNAIRRIRFGNAARPSTEETRRIWHPGEDYRAPAIRSSQGRDTGKGTGVVGPRYVKPGAKK